jgi:hypothetical protein
MSIPPVASAACRVSWDDGRAAAGQVGGDEISLAASPGDIGDHLLAPEGVAAGDNDMRPGGAHGLRDAAADAARGAGHQRGPSVEPLGHRSASC